MSKLPSPQDVKDSLIMASVDDLIEELLSRAVIGVVCVGGVPGRRDGGLIGFKAPDSHKLKALLDALSDNADEIIQ